VTSDVLLTERAGNVLVLTLNRPEVRNALNPELKDHLIRAVREADADPVKREAIELAQKIAENAPLGIAITKKLMRERRWGTAEETAAACSRS
jgi:enoyl-CoA hydratase/carnithine racemase